MLVPILMHSKTRTSSGLNLPLVLSSRMRTRNNDPTPQSDEERSVLELLRNFDPIMIGRDGYASDLLSESFNQFMRDTN